VILWDQINNARLSMVTMKVYQETRVKNNNREKQLISIAITNYETLQKFLGRYNALCALNR